MKKKALLFSAVLCLTSILTLKAQYTDIFNFNGANGSQPWGGSLILSGNRLYGLTSAGGANHYGVLFSMHLNGSGYEDLLDFNVANGINPLGSLIVSGDKLYGMTDEGGLYNGGDVFAIDTNGTNFRDILDFDTLNGLYPQYGALTLIGKKLYGMTVWGGSLSYGVIFSVDTDGNNQNVLHNFNNTQGEYPLGSLTFFGNKLYGMTEGGGAYNNGIIFSIDTNGSNFRDLFDFNGTNGQAPLASLVLVGKNLYGTTQTGGVNNDGNIFSIDTNGNNFRDLFDFNGTNGQIPTGGLIFSANTGLLYGMTGNGGANNDGNIFSIDTNGTGFMDIFDFGGINGAVGIGDLMMFNNVLYGMTVSGGINDSGAVFSDSIRINTTGVRNIASNKEEISIYPNPGSGEFVIQNISGVNEQSIIDVYNVLGEQIFESNITKSKMAFDISSQSNGIYLYRITSLNGEIIKQGKLIIQK